MVFRSCPFMTSSEKAAPPMDAIHPDSDGLSGGGANLGGTSRSGTGVAQQAKVKHTIKIEARLSAVRNRIDFSHFVHSVLTGAKWEGRKEPIVRAPESASEVLSSKPHAPSPRSMFILD